MKCVYKSTIYTFVIRDKIWTPPPFVVQKCTCYFCVLGPENTPPTPYMSGTFVLQIVEAIIGLELCEQSCTKRAALCQGRIHASEAARSAAELARYQGKKVHPP